MTDSYKSPLHTTWQLVPHTHVRENIVTINFDIRVAGKCYKNIRNEENIAWSPDALNFSMLSVCNIEKLGGSGDEARNLVLGQNFGHECYKLCIFIGHVHI